jgi:GMP synthase (glutamine-hydrolysing)
MERWLIGHTSELTAAGVDVHGLRADTARHGVALEAASKAVWRRWLADAGLSPSPG